MDGQVASLDHFVPEEREAGPGSDKPRKHRFERRLATAGFVVDVLRVAARKGSRARHVIFMAEHPGER